MRAYAAGAPSGRRCAGPEGMLPWLPGRGPTTREKGSEMSIVLIILLVILVVLLVSVVRGW